MESMICMFDSSKKVGHLSIMFVTSPLLWKEPYYTGSRAAPWMRRHPQGHNLYHILLLGGVKGSEGRHSGPEKYRRIGIGTIDANWIATSISSNWIEVPTRTVELV